jgi:hypothetical protein
MNRAVVPRTAWWEEAGPDYCEFCQHAFRVEVGFHCADCDRPICPVCVIRVREWAACPECCTEREER